MKKACNLKILMVKPLPVKQSMFNFCVWGENHHVGNITIAGLLH